MFHKSLKTVLAVAKEASYKRVLQICFVSIVLYVLYCSPVAGGEEWVFISKDEKGIFYDRERITYPAPDTVRVWVWSNDSMSFYEIKCPTKQLRILHVIKYDSKGNVLWSHSFSSEKWFVITPLSIEGELHKAVCYQRRKK